MDRMLVTFELDDFALMPVRAHVKDAGIDRELLGDKSPSFLLQPPLRLCPEGLRCLTRCPQALGSDGSRPTGRLFQAASSSLRMRMPSSRMFMAAF